MKELSRRGLDPLSKGLFALIGLVFTGFGIGILVHGYVLPRSTRFGMAGALFGSDATIFGVVFIALGLLPLGALAKTPKVAGIWASCCGLVAVLVAFFGNRLLLLLGTGAG